ncbi:flavodoxin family protein [Megasphaera paucivorans]|uniref:Multimeric flavodoxin WrbA n=1 Tax=Megasphaera paucivorans TaxID=349095 RepID=A0A1G9QH17_9FIRM|nr:flavodoxin family protein [Megasphaera paucivorans]SDM10352.1 Multimeric flavodoxin WrbA [Megasphaera paucivorans]
MNNKIMGITAGRKNSNSEILLKEALLQCQKQGAEIRLVNLRDYHIEDCIGCTTCTKGMSQGKNVGCVLDAKDDKKKIMQAMLAADGVIFSAPTYDLIVCATFLRFAQRSLSYETSFLETIGAIPHKDRVAALIAVGGSTRSWMSMSLESMQAAMFTTDMKVIDMYLATRIPAPAQCLLHDDMIARAGLVGSHIIKAVRTSAKSRTWLGDKDMGWCPNCHSNALVLGEPQWDGLHFPVECQVCGAGGTLEQMENGKWKFVIQDNGLSRDRTTVSGRAKHLEEIKCTQGGFFADSENMKIVREKLKKYANLKIKGIE